MKKLSKIILYVLLAACAVWAVMLSLGAFGAIKTNAFASEHFNYVIALVVDIVCLVLFVGLLFIEKIRGLTIPEWFKIVFYVEFFVLTNVYCYFGLYQTAAGLIVCAIMLAIIFNILSVSVFYNTQKDESNNVKVSEKFLVFSCFGYSILFAFVYEIIQCLIRLSASSVLNVLAVMAAEMGMFLLVSFAFALVFALSLKRSKRIINACLIKLNKPNEYKNKK